MALKKEDQSSTLDKVTVADSTKPERKTKSKLVKKHSTNKAELRVRKRPVTNGSKEISSNNITDINQFNLGYQSVPHAMSYPNPQYYQGAISEWSPIIPVPCPVYSLQTLPVIVNPPLLYTQISPNLPILPTIPAVTEANEVPVSLLVPVQNEYAIQYLPNDVSPMETTMYEFSPAYTEMSPPISSEFTNVSMCNEEALSRTHFPNCCSPFPSHMFNEVTPGLTPIPNEFSPLVPCEFSQLGTHTQHIYSPVQSWQVPHGFIPVCCDVSNEISPISSYRYEPTSYDLSEHENLQAQEAEYVSNVISPSSSCYNESISYDYSQHEPISFIENLQAENVEEVKDNTENSLDFYLSLPKHLFPTAKMLPMDPNAIIEEFCKVVNLDDYSWILDLEFGIPKVPVTRPLATYNVKLNRIHCKNTPEAIHPGFESCDKDLKRAMMFYYDGVFSNWYKGYIAISSDNSVENFQSWLLPPMQAFGMCWPFN